MKITDPKMAKGFGELAKIRNIVEFRLSPYELKPFAGALTHGVPNMFRRFCYQFVRIAPPMAVAYGIYEWAEAENARLSRKNPADYANDK